MDENAQSFSSIYSQQETPKIYLPKPSNSTSSGITLVLPSLKSLKASQALKLRSPATPATPTTPQSISHFRDVDIQERKIPRPLKLKPLKEVLSKLVAQIKKKDDYAFFLSPVDVKNVPGYSDVVKHPMDLGTMTDKVNRGKYRSLEDFAADFKLVTNNAKIFNPPGSIYYTEADKIEAWGMDHITKAAPTVIQYETDWNIDIEKDEEPTAINVEDDDDGTPMAVDQSNLRERSGSVLSQQPPQHGSSRRGPRGPYSKKHGQGHALSETLEPDGSLPGSKDGIGAFPSGSDWAKTMLTLKQKGKRYKTKKERLKIERDGPPLLADGSLDYTEMEDPFSVLSFFVPDPPSRPHLVPLYPPLHNPPPPIHPQQIQSDPSSSSHPTSLPSQAPSTIRQSTFPSATSLSLERNTPHVSNLQTLSDTYGNSSGNQAPSQMTSHAQQPRRRHWNIIRNASSRQKGKEKEDEQESGELPAWQMPREPHAVDFGSFSLLSAELSDEMQRRRVEFYPPSSTTSVPGAAETPITSGAPGSALTSAPSMVNTEQNASLDDLDQSVTTMLLKNSLDVGTVAKKAAVEDVHSNFALPGSNAKQLCEGYFTDQRAAEAEAYLRDVVYGGVEGYAYIRSLAEFVNGDVLLDEEDRTERTPSAELGGLSLARWVEHNVVDPLTDGRHSLLRDSALAIGRLSQQNSTHSPSSSIFGSNVEDRRLEKQVEASLNLYPTAVVALSALLQIRLHKIDMGSLIKSPDELFLSEEEWAGKGLKEKKRLRNEAALSQTHSTTGEDQDVKMEVDAEPSALGEATKCGVAVPMEVEEPEKTWVGVSAEVLNADAIKERVNSRLANYELEGPEELNEVLEYVASAIVELDQRTREALVASGSDKRTDGSFVNGSAQGGAVSSVVKDEQNGSHVTQKLSPEPVTDDASDGQNQPSGPSSATATTTMSSPLLEDAALRNLRLNLLALAKRAPLDTIARLPRDLVPEHIRHFVPTLGST